MRFSRRGSLASTPAVALVLLLLPANGALSARPDEALSEVGSVPREVADSRDIARLDGGLRVDRVILVLRRRNAGGLARLLAEQYDPASPDFHRWLSPAEFERRFGASDEDVAAVENWLTSHGLEIENAPAGRAALVFSGRAADVEGAFDTELHEIYAEGRVRVANVRAPRLPSGLARRVAGVFSLHSFPRLHPLVHRRPETTIAEGHLLSPADFAAIYNVDALTSAGLTGTGRTIGLLGRSNVSVADTTFFRTYFGLPANDPSVVVNGPDPGVSEEDEVESDLDVQWAGAIAPAARTVLVTSKSTLTTDGIDLSALYAVGHDLVDVLSVSYGACESFVGEAEIAFYANVWAQAAAQGMSVMVASGDSGVAGCQRSFDVFGTRAGVNGLGSSPYVTSWAERSFSTRATRRAIGTQRTTRRRRSP